VTWLNRTHARNKCLNFKSAVFVNSNSYRSNLAYRWVQKQGGPLASSQAIILDYSAKGPVIMRGSQKQPEMLFDHRHPFGKTLLKIVFSSVIIPGEGDQMLPFWARVYRNYPIIILTSDSDQLEQSVEYIVTAEPPLEHGFWWRRRQVKTEEFKTPFWQYVDMKKICHAILYREMLKRMKEAPEKENLLEMKRYSLIVWMMIGILNGTDFVEKKHVTPGIGFDGIVKFVESQKLLLDEVDLNTYTLYHNHSHVWPVPISSFKWLPNPNHKLVSWKVGHILFRKFNIWLRGDYTAADGKDVPNRIGDVLARTKILERVLLYLSPVHYKLDPALLTFFVNMKQQLLKGQNAATFNCERAVRDVSWNLQYWCINWGTRKTYEP
jgi:hypothetical protein